MTKRWRAKRWRAYTAWISWTKGGVTFWEGQNGMRRDFIKLLRKFNYFIKSFNKINISKVTWI